MSDAPQPLSENERVLQWRMDMLEKAGYPLYTSLLLASADVDLHLAIHLIETGCSPETAFRILN